jgi:hypothetical protein
MGYTYDLDTDVGTVRLLVQDNDLSKVTGALETRSVAFSDEEIAKFIALAGPDLRMAAAATLRAWATNKQLIVVSRHFKSGSVDYGAIRADMLAAAKAYEEQAISAPADAIAEQAWTEFNAERIVVNAWSREAL